MPPARLPAGPSPFGFSAARLRIHARCALTFVAAAAVGCDRGPSANADLPATIALSATFPADAAAGDADAYDAADAIHIRLGAPGAAPIVDEVLSFAPASPENSIRIELRVSQSSAMLLEIEIRRRQDALFRGTAQITIQPGRRTAANVALEPVPAGIVIPDSIGPLVSIGETVPLEGDVVFATGDVSSSLSLDWRSLDPDVALVGTGDGVPVVRAVGDGDARIEASHGAFSEILTTIVNLQVAAVVVEPAAASIPIAGTVQLTAIARDALGTAQPDRPPVWTSADGAVAAVDGNGLVRGLRAGTALVTAEVEGVRGTAQVEVVPAPPVVRTAMAVGLSSTGAQLRGVVNPRGAVTTAWFEWGTDAALDAFERTPDELVGAGTSDVEYGTAITGLQTGTRYHFRAVAVNEAGTTRGEIERFDTPDMPAPDVITLPASGPGLTGATLLGSVTSTGPAPTAWFEWADNPSLSGFTTTSATLAGSGSGRFDAEARISGLDPESAYYFRAAARNAGGTARGAILSFRTRLPAPSGLFTTFIPAVVFVRWQDNSTTETEFRVERSTVSETTGFSVVGSSPADSTAYVDSPLPVGEVYYRVRACNGADCSVPSGARSINIPLPNIRGTLRECDAVQCYPAGGVHVRLTGPVTRSTTSNASTGSYQFLAVPAGTYTITLTEPCEIEFPTNPRTITVSGGQNAVADFRGNTVVC